VTRLKKERGKAKRSQGSGWSSTRARQETIQSKASKKKEKDRKSSRDSILRITKASAPAEAIY
jgi:hypothetical protein